MKASLRSTLRLVILLAALLGLRGRLAASDTWVGHGPEAGIVNALVIDPSSPSTLYAGTSYGGVFKSTNGGASWAASNNGLAVRLVSALAIDPANPSTIYAGTQSQALDQPSLFKSTDAGASWVPSATGLTGPFGYYASVDCIVVDPSTPATLYAGTQAGPYKSTDAGASWNSVGTFSVSSLAIDPSTPATLYAGSTAAMYKSTDSGANWLQIGDFTGTTVVAIVIDPSAPAVLYAAHANGVSKSVDGGQNWQSLPTGLTYPNLWELAIDSSNHNVLYVGGRSGYLDEYGVFKTSDGGANWTQVLVGMEDQFSVGAIAVDPASPSTVYAGGWSSNYKFNSRSSPGGVYKSINGASSWARANNGLSNSFVHSVTVNPVNPDTLYAGLSNYLSPSTTNFGVSRSVDGGTTWSLASEGLLDPYFEKTSPIYDIVVDPSSPSRLYAAGAGGVFKSFDGGDNWVPLGTGIAFNQYGVDIAINPASPSTLYLATSNGYGLYRSTDSGANWSLIRSAYAFALDLASPNVLYAAEATGAGVSRSTDGGDTWGDPVPACFSLNALAVAADSSAVYAGCYDGVWKSTDGSATWNPSNDGLSNLFVTSLLADPAHPNTIYVGANQNLYNTGAVFRSTDAGAHWSVVGEGLPPLFVYGMALSPTGKLYAATEGGGVFAVDVCNPIPAPTVSNNGPVCEGQPLNLMASPISGATYAWTGPNGFTSSLQNPTISNATTAAAGVYSVVATVSNCQTSPADTPVVVNPAPIATASGSATITLGQSTPLSGSGGVTCSWSPAGGLDNANSCSPNASPSATTVYTLAVTDGNGCVSANNPTVTVTVMSPTSTTTAMVSSMNPSTFGQPVMLSASVTASSGTPVGPLTFRDGAIVIGTTTLDGSGSAVLVTSVLATGTHSITAFYGGGTGFAPSSSVALMQTVTNPAACGTLQPAVSFSAGSTPYSLALGDFDADGKLDIAVANNQIVDLTILLGNGDGTFHSGGSYGAGGNATSVAVGDFNGDGKLDLAVNSSALNYVSILIGNGNGTFQSPENYPVGTTPGAVAVGDLDGDGKLDLVVPNGNSNDVSVLLGNGDGTFRAAVSYAAGNTPSKAAIGDFNVDGRLDLAVTNANSNNVSILMGNGNGTFQAPVNYAAGSSPFRIRTSDLNGDGKLDLILTNSGTSDLSVLLGNGNGTFQAATALDIGGFQPRSVAVGDVNGDGKPDLAVADGNHIQVLIGNGDGIFQPPATYTTAANSLDVSIADFDSDGKPDVAVASYSAGSVLILRGACPTATATVSGGGTICVGASAAIQAALTGTPPWSLTWSDGVTQSSVATSPATRSVSPAGSTTYTVTAFSDAVGPGTASGSATVDMNPRPSAVITVPSLVDSGATGLIASVPDAGPGAAYSWSIAGGSITLGQGTPSVTFTAASSNPISVSVTMQNAQGCGASATRLVGVRQCGARYFAGPNVPVGAQTLRVVSADFNGDGKPDVAMTFYNTPAPPGGIGVALNDGSGGFGPVSYLSVPPSGQGDILAGDYNRDGKVDLLAATAFGVYFLPGHGDGTFGAGVLVSNFAPTAIAAGDVNHDGFVDLIAVESSTLTVLLGDGVGGFTMAGTIAVGRASEVVTIADLDGDGRLDVAVGSFFQDGITVLFGDGAGNFGSALTLAVPLTLFGTQDDVSGLTLADLDGDGRSDLISSGYLTRTISVFRSLGGRSFAPRVDFPANFGAFRMLSGDFDSDGRADVAVVSNFGANSALSVYWGDGTGSLGARSDFAVGSDSQSVAAADLNGDGQADLIVGNFSTKDITVLFNASVGTPTARVSGGAIICGGSTAQVETILTGLGPWHLTWSDGFSEVVTASPTFRPVNPTVTTTYSISTLSGSSICPGIASGNATITVRPGPVLIAPATLPGGAVGVAYSQTITASGGTAPYTFVVSRGSLAPGMTLNPSTGLVSGTPTSGGVFSPEVQVTDAVGCGLIQRYTLTVTTDSTPPSIAVLLPNGGERVFTGSAYVIQWTASDNVALNGFSVSYSTDGGSTFADVPGCTNLPASATSCVWAAPGPTTTTGRVRVQARDTSGNTALDDSNANFSIIAGTASVTVTSPNTAVTWRIGDVRNITFSHTLGIGQKVSIEVSRDGGGTWASLNPAFSTVNASTGSWPWAVTGPVTVQALVRVVWSGNPAVVDQGNVNFTILDRVTLTAPNTAVTWAAETSHAITWTHNLPAGESVNLEVSRDVGSTWSPIATVLATATPYTWTVTGPASTTCLVRVSWSANPSNNDVSNVPFTIAAPTIAVTSPNTAVTWRIGDNRNINFTHNLGIGQTVNIDISRDGGATFTPIGPFTTVAAGSGSFPWTVTGPVTGQGRVRVTWATDPTVTSTSAVNFTIIDRITVTAPNTAVTWTAETVHAVTWTHNLPAGEQVVIQLSRDGGANWEAPIATVLATATPFNWTVTRPPTAGAQALIRVSWAANPANNDVSNVPFTIAAPTIAVTSPNTAVTWRIGDNRNITFTHNLGVGQTVNIDISRDGGATFTPIGPFTTVAAGSGSFPWTVTGPVTGQARIRVTWATDPTVTQTSAVNFTILDRITVTAPNTAVTWIVGSNHNITFGHNLGVGQTVVVDVSRDSGATWSFVTTFVTTAAATGFVPWTVSGPASAQARIRVSWQADLTVSDRSDVDFKIQ